MICTGRFFTAGGDGLSLAAACLFAHWVNHASLDVRQRFPRGGVRHGHVGSLGEHASRDVRLRFPRGAEGPYGDGPSALPAPSSNYPGEQRAVALPLKWARLGIGGADAVGGPRRCEASRRPENPAPPRARPRFAWPWLRAFSAVVRSVLLLPLVHDSLLFLRHGLRDVEGVVRRAPRWLFGGANLCGSDSAASLLEVMLVGLRLCLVLLRCCVGVGSHGNVPSLRCDCGCPSSALHGSVRGNAAYRAFSDRQIGERAGHLELAQEDARHCVSMAERSVLLKHT